MTKDESNLRIEARTVWTARTEHGDDSALESSAAGESGGALRLPPQSKTPASPSPFVLRHLAFVILLLLFTAGCDWMPGKPKFADRWIPDTAVTNFAALYQTHCAACHAGGDGRLAAAHPLNDAVLLAVTDPEAFEKAVADGVPDTAMPAFAESHGGPLTDAQISLIVTNIFANWSRPQDFSGLKLPPHRAPLGDSKRGAGAYRTYCASCHGAEGKGGEKAGPVIAPSFLALVSDQGLRTTVIAGRADLGMPDWRGYVAGKSMSDQEIADVVAWLASHRIK